MGFGCTLFQDSRRLAAAANNSPPIARSEKDCDAVRRIQAALMRLGSPLPGSMDRTRGLDGLFGPETEAAVRRFQRDAGLKPDGVVGRTSLARLDALLRKLEPPATLSLVNVVRANSLP